MAKKHKSTGPALSKAKSAKRRKDRKRNLIWLWVGLGIAVLAVAVFFLMRPKAAIAAEISPAQAYGKFQQGAFFLDVRSAEEWAQIHIAKSTLIPLDELNNRLGELPKDQDIVVVCLSGQRSKEGLAILQQAGFKRAFCMNGGIEAWKAAGYPVEGNAP
jgi:rhodanese-related sulfurtransferase